jgi:GAF domain-containing protein
MTIPPSFIRKWLPMRDQPRLLNCETEAKEFEVLRYIVGREIQSWVSAPLILQDKLAGSIELTSYRSDRFHEADKYTLLRIAQLAALAINNSRLYVKLLNSLKEISEARKEVERVRRGQLL